MIDGMDQIKVNYQIDPTAKGLAVEFLKWCTEPVARKSFSMKHPRAVAQVPDYKDFIVIDKTGRSILGEGIFLTHEQLFDYWLNHRRSN